MISTISIAVLIEAIFARLEACKRYAGLGKPENGDKASLMRALNGSYPGMKEVELTNISDYACSCCNGMPPEPFSYSIGTVGHEVREKIQSRYRTEVVFHKLVVAMTGLTFANSFKSLMHIIRAWKNGELNWTLSGYNFRSTRKPVIAADCTMEILVVSSNSVPRGVHFNPGTWESLFHSMVPREARKVFTKKRAWVRPNPVDEYHKVRKTFTPNEDNSGKIHFLMRESTKISLEKDGENVFYCFHNDSEKTRVVVTGREDVASAVEAFLKGDAEVTRDGHPVWPPVETTGLCWERKEHVKFSREDLHIRLGRCPEVTSVKRDPKPHWVTVCTRVPAFTPTQESMEEDARKLFCLRPCQDFITKELPAIDTGRGVETRYDLDVIQNGSVIESFKEEYRKESGGIWAKYFQKHPDELRVELFTGSLDYILSQ